MKKIFSSPVSLLDCDVRMRVVFQQRKFCILRTELNFLFYTKN